MELAIYNYRQEHVMHYDLDGDDLILMRFIERFMRNMKQNEIEGETYYWLSMNYVMESLPYLKCTKRTLRRRFQKLEEKGLIKRRVFQQKGNFLCIRFTDAYEMMSRQSSEKKDQKDLGQKCPNETKSKDKNDPILGQKCPKTLGQKCPNKDHSTILNPSTRPNPPYSPPEGDGGEDNLSQDIETLWKAYQPVGRIKGSKKKFNEQVRRKTKDGTTIATIRAGIDSYIAYCRANNQKTVDAFRFIRNEGYNDDYTVPELPPGTQAVSDRSPHAGYSRGPSQRDIFRAAAAKANERFSKEYAEAGVGEGEMDEHLHGINPPF